MESVFGRVGDTFKNIETKLGATHKAALNSFEETFEIRGEKTQAQIELEAWNARVEEERARSQEGSAPSPHNGGFDDKEFPAPRRANPVDLDDMSAPPSAAFSLETDEPAPPRSPVSTHLDPTAAAAAASALRQVRLNMGPALRSDDQASATDKVIHQQRMQLIALKKERMAFEQEREDMHAQVKLLQADEAGGGVPASGVESPAVPFSGARRSEQARELIARIQKVPPRRFIGLIAIFVAVILVAFRMQRSLDRSATADSVGWDLRVERHEMEKLVASLMRDKALLVKGKRGGNSTAPSKNMERHLETVQKMLNSMHERHLQSRDKVHQVLSRQNEKLAAELASLKGQIRGQLQGGNGTTSVGKGAKGAQGTPAVGLKAR
mmetsp:Transcript_15565/g.37607  ORF Transcript_15565/g.37607 Transcript_15565/m.37607 type:complete len:381 (-) Transcript_15565:59-1201(-)